MAQSLHSEAVTKPGLSYALKQHYSAGLLFFATGIVALGILDAFMTLLLLNTGAVVELNPIMLAFIEHDIRLFLIAKGIITGTSVVALVACTSVPQLSRLNAMLVIQGLFVIYVILICYEFQLLYRLL